MADIRLLRSALTPVILTALLGARVSRGAPVVSDGGEPQLLRGTSLRVVLPAGTQVKSDPMAAQWAVMSGTDQLEYAGVQLTVSATGEPCPPSSSEGSVTNLPTGWVEIDPDEHGQVRACWTQGVRHVTVKGVNAKAMDAAPVRPVLAALAIADRAPIQAAFPTLGLSFAK